MIFDPAEIYLDYSEFEILDEFEETLKDEIDQRNAKILYRYSDSQELVWDDAEADDWDDDLRGLSFWKTKNLQSDACSLGDVMNFGNTEYGEEGRVGRLRSKKQHILVKENTEDGIGVYLKHPESFEVDYTYGKLKLYRMKEPEGYKCLGGVARVGDETPIATDYCCVKSLYTSPAEQSLVYSKMPKSKKKHPGYLSQVVRSPYDTTGVIGGQFLSQEKVYENDRSVAILFLFKHYVLLREDGHHVQQAFEMKGSSDMPIQLNEVGVSAIWKLNCTVEKCPAKDESTLFKDSFGIYRAKVSENQVLLGDIFAPGDTIPDIGFSAKGLKDDAISPPLSFLEVPFPKLNGKENLKLWEAQCISGFSPLGLMATPIQNGTAEKPKVETFGCINDKYFDNGQGVRYKYKLRGEGSNNKHIFTMDKMEPRSATQETNHFMVFDRNSNDGHHKAKMLATKYIQYRAEKPLLDQTMIEVALDFESEDVDPRQLKELDKGEVENLSHIPQCATRIRKVENTEKENFMFAFGGKLEAGINMKFGDGFIANMMSLGLKASFTGDQSDLSSTEETDSTTISATLTVPENAKMSVSIMAKDSERNIPWQGVLKKTYMDGSVRYVNQRGVFNGVSTSEAWVELSDFHFFGGEKRYTDKIGLIFEEIENSEIWKNTGGGFNYEQGTAKEEIGIWGPNIQELQTFERGYCSIGDIVEKGYGTPRIRHKIVFPVHPGAVAKPMGFMEQFDDTGSGVDNPVTIYGMVPPCGYRCIGDVAVPSRDQLPNRNHYCCINREYIEPLSNDLAWDNEGSSDMRTSALWWTTNSEAKPNAGYESQNFKAVLGYDGPNKGGRLLRKDRVKPKVAYVWSSWSQYEACNVECGWGEQRRSRSCQKTDLKKGAVIEKTQNFDLCGGSEKDAMPCKMEDCVLCQSIQGEVSPFVFEEYERKIIDEEFFNNEKPKDYNPKFTNTEINSEEDCKALCANSAGCQSFIWDTKKFDCDVYFMPLKFTYEPSMQNFNCGKLSALCGERFHNDIVEYTTRSLSYNGKFQDLVKIIMDAEAAKPANERLLNKWEFTNNPRNTLFYRLVYFLKTY